MFIHWLSPIQCTDYCPKSGNYTDRQLRSIVNF